MSSPAPILLVEDDENDVFFFQRAAAKAKITNALQVVRDGQEAIEYLSGSGPFHDRAKFPLPCLILLDLNLPRKDGFEILRAIRQMRHAKTTLVLVLTSSASEADMHEAYHCGANSYLVKPSDPEKFRELVSLLKHYWLDINQPPPAPETVEQG